MNPLQFLFNGQKPQQAPAWFQAATQGVSSFSNGINPASLEAQVDFGAGNLLQYSSINSLAIGTLQGLFQQVLGSGVQNVISNFLSGGLLGVFVPGWSQLNQQAAQAYVQSGGGVTG